jgi:very-short-patch-repair endonuclease
MTALNAERRLRAIARRQHGVFLLRQAVDAGFTRPAIRRRLDRHVWEEVVPRVYRASVSRPVDWRQTLMGVVLLTRGVASGASAGALYGLLREPPRIEVTAARASRLELPAEVHTSSALSEVDVTTVDGIPATTPARTLIDLGGRLPRSVFEDALDTAIVQRLVTFDRLHTRAVDLWAPRRNGCAIVLDLLSQRDPNLARAANLWEAKVLRVVRDLGLPPPRVNYRVHVGGKRRYLDLAWPEAKVAVEFDGFVPHSTRRVFDDDRARQNHLVAADWTVFRVTKTMLDADALSTFRPIATMIDAKLARNRTPTFENAQV